MEFSQMTFVFEPKQQKYSALQNGQQPNAKIDKTMTGHRP
jgi:hypothetical protein